MSGHTPGPWVVANKVQVHDKKLGGVIACCVRYARHDSVDQANANLIAAAPDLLEALENLIDSRGMDDLEPARKAIARAKGEA